MNINDDEEVFEGQLFGWRWFAFFPGPDLLVSPTFSMNREVSPFSSNSASVETVKSLYHTYDTLDWNEADRAPEMHSRHGFWVFDTYAGSIAKYTPTIYADCKTPYLMPGSVKEVPEGWDSLTIHSPWGTLRRVIFKAIPVLGFVEMSGIVVEHEHGYRAQRVRIVKLYSPERKNKRNRLAEALGWPDEIRRVRKFFDYKNPVETDLRRLEL